MRRSPALAVLALTVGGCFGGGEEERRRAATPTATRTAPPSGAVTRSEEATIRGWVDALRGGDVEAASRYFALPATVANGSAPIELRTQRAVRFFNETLPCGARLVATERAERGFVVATFRLTERPGEGVCGGGTGHLAYTAFLIRKGKIVQWLRVAGADDVAPEAEGSES